MYLTFIYMITTSIICTAPQPISNCPKEEMQEHGRTQAQHSKDFHNVHPIFPHDNPGM